MADNQSSPPPVAKRSSLSANSVYVKVLMLWVMGSLLYASRGSYLSETLWYAIGIFAITGWVILFKFKVRSTWTTFLPFAIVIVAFSWPILDAPGPHWPLICAAPLPLAAIAIGLPASPWLRYLGWVVLILLEGICIALAWHWGRVNIDVFAISQQGALDFLRGTNPYQSWFHSTTVEVARFRYDYGPLWLLLTAPFARLGDVRVLVGLSSIGIICLGAWRYGWRQYSTWIWVALLLLSPWLAWTTIMAWTELVMMSLLLAWYATYQQWRWSWVFLAVALGANPIIAVLLLPMFVVIPETRRQIICAGCAAAICWLAALGLSGADFIQAFRIAGTQGYEPTISLGGFYLILTNHPIPKIATIIIALGITAYLWRYRAADLWQRELLVGFGCLAIVWVMPASYFEYTLIPALWLWWTLGRATSLFAPTLKA